MIPDGSVICWGGGEHGQIGRGSECKVFGAGESAGVPLESLPASELYHVSCGTSHTICASKDGES